MEHNTITVIISIAALVIAGIGVWVAYKQLDRLAVSTENAVISAQSSARSAESTAQSAQSAARSAESAQRANSIQIVQVMLQLYQLITDSAGKMQEAATIISGISIRREQGEQITKSEVQAAQLRLNARIQDYLNSLDTLSSCFLKDTELENAYRLDYRDMIFEAVDTYGEHFGTARQKYHNLQDIYNKWKRV